MSKTLLYKLFKVGAIPKKLLPTIEAEGILFQEEGISCVTQFTRFRAPGKYYGKKWVWGTGAIVLTEAHLLAFRYMSVNIGVTWEEMKAREMKYYIDNKSRLCIEYDAAKFNEQWSGNVVVKFSSAQSQTILRLIREIVAS